MQSHNLNSFFEKVLPYIDNSENLIEIVCAIIIIFAMIFGLFLGEVLPNFIALCGIFVIALSGVLLAKQK